MYRDSSNGGGPVLRRTTRRLLAHLSLAILILVMLSMGVRAVQADISAVDQAIASPAVPGVPTELDSFLSDVRSVTPASARIVTAGSGSVIIWYRATFVLYPRQVFSAVPPTYDVPPPPLIWADLADAAQLYHAQYVLLWDQSVPPRGTVVLREHLGLLVRVNR